MKKKILLSIFLGCSLLFAQVRVGILNGPSCVPVANLLENVVSINNESVEYESYASAFILTTALVKKEIDVGFLPPNLAAIYFNGTDNPDDNILCTAITGYGNLALICKDTSVKNLSDLKDKTVYVAGQAATPEYMLRYLLEKNKIKYDTGKSGSVTLDFSIPNNQIAPMFVSGKIDCVLVPEPFATVIKMNYKGTYSLIDIQEEYKKLNPKTPEYPLTVMVVRREFAQNHTETMNKFLEEYKASYEWTMDNALESGKLCEELELGLKAAIVSNSIPYANYTFVTGTQARAQLEQILKIFYEQDPVSVGGKLPEQDFYY